MQKRRLLRARTQDLWRPVLPRRRPVLWRGLLPVGGGVSAKSVLCLRKRVWRQVLPAQRHMLRHRVLRIPQLLRQPGHRIVLRRRHWGSLRRAMLPSRPTLRKWSLLLWGSLQQYLLPTGSYLCARTGLCSCNSDLWKPAAALRQPGWLQADLLRSLLGWGLPGFLHPFRTVRRELRVVETALSIMRQRRNFYA